MSSTETRAVKSRYGRDKTLQRHIYICSRNIPKQSITPSVVGQQEVGGEEEKKIISV